MSVIIRTPSITPGVPVPTSFSDAFSTGDATLGNIQRPNGLNWFIGMGMNGSALAGVGMSAASIVNSVFDGQPCLQLSSIGQSGPNNNVPLWMLPTSVYRSLYGKTQFIQCTMVSRNVSGGGIFSGGILCAVPSGTNGGTNAGTGLFGYIYVIKASDGSAQLIRTGRDGENDSVSLATDIAGTWVNGDVLRFSADMSVTTQTVLTWKKNGVQVQTFTDNTGNRINGIGSPGLCTFAPSQSAGAGSNIEWRTFSCGIGL